MASAVAVAPLKACQHTCQPINISALIALHLPDTAPVSAPHWGPDQQEQLRAQTTWLSWLKALKPSTT
ncbi:unnamed protein product [Arctogadus glacialis]